MALISHALMGFNIGALALMCFSSGIRTLVQEPEHGRSALHLVAYKATSGNSGYLRKVSGIRFRHTHSTTINAV